MAIQTGGRQILIHGLMLILAGLLWGFAPPMTPFPRLALGAHIQFETNGLLFMAVGILLLGLPHRGHAGRSDGRGAVAGAHHKVVPHTRGAGPDSLLRAPDHRFREAHRIGKPA